MALGERHDVPFISHFHFIFHISSNMLLSLAVYIYPNLLVYQFLAMNYIWSTATASDSHHFSQVCIRLLSRSQLLNTGIIEQKWIFT